MADEITRGVIAIDSTSAVTAAKNLDDLTAAGVRAGKSSREFETNLLKVNERADDFGLSVRGLTKAEAEYADTIRDRAITLERMAARQKILDAQNKKNAASTKKLSDSHRELSFTSGQVVREYAVLINELQRGDFTRFQGSLITLGNRTNLIQKAFTGLGPVVLAATAVFGTMAAATLKLAVEHRELEKTLIRTNFASGLTADGAVEMSRRFAEASVSIGSAKDAVRAVIASGAIGSERIGQTAKAALDNLVLTGAQVEKTISIIERLRDRPLQALIEVNKQFNFLSVAAFESVRELELSGDTFAAGEQSVKLFSEALARMRKETEDSAGVFSKLGTAISNAFSGALDSIGNFSIVPDAEQALSSLSSQMSRLLVQIDELKDKEKDGGLDIFGRFELNRAEDTLRKLSEAQRSISKILAPKRDAQAESEASSAEARDVSRFAALVTRLDTIDTKLVREKRRQRELRQEAKETAEALEISARTGISDPSVTKEAQQARIDAINRRFRDQEPRKEGKSDAQKEADRLTRQQAAGLAALNKILTENNALLDASSDGQIQLSAVSRIAVKTLADLEAGNLKINDAHKDGARLALNELIARDKLTQANKEAARVDELSADIADRLAKISKGQAAAADDEIRSITRSSAESEIAFRLDSIRLQVDRERMTLADRFGDVTSENNERYVSELAKINSAEQELLNNEIEAFNRRQEALNDWRAGLRVGVEEFISSSTQSAITVRDITIGAFDGMANSIVSFTQTGKLGFKSLASSIIADLIRMEAKILLSSILRSLLGAFLGGGSSLTGIKGGVGDAGFDASRLAAKGGIFEAGMPIQNYANGGIIGKPTLLGMAGGKLLQAGEDGKEAIMPVKQDSRGRLGVLSVGGGGGSDGGVVQLTIQVFQGKGEGVTSEVGQKQDGRALIKLMLGEVSSNISSNGSVAKTITDTFGLKRSARR